MTMNILAKTFKISYNKRIYLVFDLKEKRKQKRVRLPSLEGLITCFLWYVIPVFWLRAIQEHWELFPLACPYIWGKKTISNICDLISHCKEADQLLEIICVQHLKRIFLFLLLGKYKGSYKYKTYLNFKTTKKMFSTI